MFRQTSFLLCPCQEAEDCLHAFANVFATLQAQSPITFYDLSGDVAEDWVSILKVYELHFGDPAAAVLPPVLRVCLSHDALPPPTLRLGVSHVRSVLPSLSHAFFLCPVHVSRVSC